MDVPTQIEIGFDQFKTWVMKGGWVELTKNLPYSATMVFTSPSGWSKEVDVMVLYSAETQAHYKMKHPWFVAFKFHDKKKKTVTSISDFPPTASIEEFRNFCLKFLKTEIDRRVPAKVRERKT